MRFHLLFKVVHNVLSPMKDKYKCPDFKSDLLH